MSKIFKHELSYRLYGEKGKNMYTIDEKKFEAAEDVAQYVIDNIDLWDEYDEALDECYEVNVCGFSYEPSEALRRMDEVAYRCGYYDYLNVFYENLLYEFEHMTDGDDFLIDEFDVIFTEEEQE